MEDINKKPLLLFAPIYDYVASEFVDKMNDYPEDEDLEIWVNSPGGRVFAGWSIIGAMQKRTGKNNVTIMGHAASMSVFFALFADYTEALEVTQFMIHRADGYVDTPEDQAFLNRINKDLRKKMEERLNMEMFESVIGKTMDDIFNPDERINIWIDAKQAKKIGLINKIRKFEQNELKAYNEFVAFADSSQRSEDKSQRSDNVQKPIIMDFSNNLNEIKMTLQELKSQNPELYQQVYESGYKDGQKIEHTRVKTWLAYLEVDKENVIASIKEGKEFTTDVMAEMSVKMTAKKTVDNIEKDSPENTPTGKADDKTEAQKELEAFEKSVKEGVNVKSINIL
jgi:ATP-dependent protease ClpP protease subunit